MQEVYGQDFDFKKEKRVENSFWNNHEKESKMKKPMKDNKPRVAQKRDSRGKGKVYA